MSERLQNLLDDLDRAAHLGNEERASLIVRLSWVRQPSGDELPALLIALAERATAGAARQSPAIWGPLLQQLTQGLPQGLSQATDATQHARAIDGISLLYKGLGKEDRIRPRLLSALSQRRATPELNRLAELLISDPPAGTVDAATPLVSLLTATDWNPGDLFPRLLDALVHPELAAAVLDLANHLFRSGRVARHPAADRAEQLREVLAGTCGRLGRLAERPDEAESIETLRRAVGEGVSLAVSLCHALALMEDRDAIGKLFQAAELGHRRVRVEAAAALVKLGEEEGAKMLAEMAAEPVVRLRVLAYADELQIAEQIAEQHRTPAARAEAELASWLAEPTRLGIPPTQCEWIDTRTQLWPGFCEPVTCHLFRFTYSLPQGIYSNIGIVGPLVHAFTVDLADLPLDDVYAAFAGWQAEHAEIVEMATNRLEAADQRVVADYIYRLHDADYEEVAPQRYCRFFERRVLAAGATREGVAGNVLIDEEHIYWHPTGSRIRPPGPAELLCIWRGKKLLAAFNAQEDDVQED